MHFSSFPEFLLMGGYAPYVWSAFLITFIAMGWVCLAAVLKHRHVLKDIQRKIAREGRLKEAEKMENTL